MTMDDFSDIIGHTYRGVTTRLPMARAARAAQFAPFSALEGFERAIREQILASQGDTPSDQQSEAYTP